MIIEIIWENKKEEDLTENVVFDKIKNLCLKIDKETGVGFFIAGKPIEMTMYKEAKEE